MSVDEGGYIVSDNGEVTFSKALLNSVSSADDKLDYYYFHVSVLSSLGANQVDQLRGVGKGMPVTMWCFTLCSVSLVGIPPLCGFVSKWYLCLGALDSGLAVFSWLGPVCLLTAGYLLPISIRAFFPGASFDYSALSVREAPAAMLLPILALTGLAAVLGLFPNLLSILLDALR
jgi:multicomponent Na+:H+ antiporter subunit D